MQTCGEQKLLNEEKDKLNSEKQEIAWGSQIRSYVLHPYQMVKDLRTSFETSDANKVLDGDIISFLEKSLFKKIYCKLEKEIGKK